MLSNDKITLEMSVNQHNSLNKVTLEFSSDVTITTLMNQIITPLLMLKGYNLETIKNGYEDEMEDILEKLESFPK